MDNYVKMAWRNIWRNKRRTLITIASVFFGVLLSAYMSSMQEGSYSQYISAVVNGYSGHMQIQQKDYWNDKIIDNTFESRRQIDSCINTIHSIIISTPRFETFTLASSGEMTKGVMVLGIDAEKENKLTHISDKLQQGGYLIPGDNGILVTSGLAKYMRLHVNDTLVLIGQGYHGVSAAGKYPVRGVVKHPSPDLNKALVYMNIEQCQELFSATNRLTSLVILVNDNTDVVPVKEKLKAMLSSELTVIDWQQMNKMLLLQIESDRESGIITKAILYIIIAFGILGTIMMMMAERSKEFGMMMAIGMLKYKLIITVVLETFFIAMISTISGIIVSIPLIYYFILNPIPLTGQAGEMMVELGFIPVMYFTMAPQVFYEQAIIIFLITMVIGVYPVWHIGRLNLMRSLHG